MPRCRGPEFQAEVRVKGCRRMVLTLRAPVLGGGVGAEPGRRG